MGDVPVVSIVLPVWNGEEYLAQALDSILGQTFRSFELIVVNDCSTDSSPRIARDYAARDNRIQVVDNERNLRLPASLNQGFGHARGQYFTWTSDDNLLHETFLETLIAELEHQSADLIYSDFNSMDEKGKVTGISRVGAPEFLVAQNVVGASFLYKKEVHERLGGYDTQRFLYEDYDFWIRAYLAGFRLVHSSSVVYAYRRHDASLTSTRKVPDEYAFYRYGLRKQFRQVTRAAAFDARIILLGYRKILGPARWIGLVGEAMLLNPAGTLRYLGGMASRLLSKLGRRAGQDGAA